MELKNSIIKEALDIARNKYLTDAKQNENLQILEEMLTEINRTICEWVINGYVTLKIKVSECKINSYAITQSKEFLVDDSCYNEEEKKCQG
jgi:hypothetical protein